jgi:hypothetical protein
VAVLLAGLLAGCRGDGPAAPAPGFGAVAGRWDGAEWAGLGYAVLENDTLDLVGHRPDPRSYYDEYVRVRVAFRGEAAYAVGAEAASLAKLVGGDAGYFPAARGELHVVDYTAGRVRGTLSLASSEPRLPWRFEGGSFDVPVYARWADVPPAPAR